MIKLVYALLFMGIESMRLRTGDDVYLETVTVEPITLTSTPCASSVEIARDGSVVTVSCDPFSSTTTTTPEPTRPYEIITSMDDTVSGNSLNVNVTEAQVTGCESYTNEVRVLMGCTAF